MRNKLHNASALAFLFTSVASGSTFANFEQFADSELITNEIAGLQFNNTIVLTAGVSLNEFEFPPHSGTNVASDFGGPITIVFSSSIVDFKGYFTYTVGLDLSALNSANAKVASSVSLFSNNEAISGVAGSSPNELIEIKDVQGFSKVVMTGNRAGASFVVDDIAFSALSPASTVPEPGCAPLLALIGFGSALYAGRRWL